MKKNLQENIVSPKNQNTASFYKYGTGEGFKILFIGNSITKHRPKPEANWFNDCGMAASDVSKDYVHQLMNMISEVKENVSYAILPIADFEWNITDFDIEGKFSEPKEYDADIIIMFFGANVDESYLQNPKPFGEAYKKLRNYFSNGQKTKFFHSAGFYIRPQFDSEKKKIADEYGDCYIDISHINSREETHGLYNHPNDLGMSEIAKVFFEKIKPFL